MTEWARKEAEALECGLLMHGHFSTEDAAERCEHSNILAIESALLKAFAAGREEGEARGREEILKQVDDIMGDYIDAHGTYLSEYALRLRERVQALSAKGKGE